MQKENQEQDLGPRKSAEEEGIFGLAGAEIADVDRGKLGFEEATRDSREQQQDSYLPNHQIAENRRPSA